MVRINKNYHYDKMKTNIWQLGLYIIYLQIKTQS